MRIDESSGTPNIVRNIINLISPDINKLISKKTNDVINLDIDEEVNIDKKKTVKLKCKLKLIVNFSDNFGYNGNINFETCIKSNFQNCIINIYSPNKNIDKLNIYKSLSHELTHLYELYQVRDVFNKSSWKNSISLVNFDGLNLNKFKLIEYFRDIFYASLSHEMRSITSSIEVFLIGLDTKDEKKLREELSKTTEWSKYKALCDFNPELYTNDIVGKYGLYFTIRSFRLFNKMINNDISLKSRDDLDRYFKNWKKYFTDISKKCGVKIDRKIKEIIDKDVSNHYMLEINDDKIISYSNYLKEPDNRDSKLYELLYPDYKKYFICI